MERPISILHVEDDPDFADLTATFLEQQDDAFDVTTATTPADAHDLLDSSEFDCVVSDHDMPGQNGIEFLSAVREEYPDLPFILFTGKGSEEVASEAISEGVTDYLQKETGTEQYALLANRIRTAVEQYHTARELERQTDLFQKAQALANVGAWEINFRNGSSYSTEEFRRIHGLDSDADVSPEQVLEYYRPEDRSAFQQALRNRESYNDELRLVTEDGDHRWVQTRSEPQAEDGDLVRLRGTIQDITDMKRRQRDLERQNDQLEDLVEIISHDIRNPLQVATGQLELAAETGDERAFRKVQQAHERIETIITDLLRLAKQGRQIGETESVDVGTLAREAWETVETADCTLTVSADIEVEADATRLRELFENVFSNAVEHAGPDCTVTVGSIEPFPTTTRGPTQTPRGFYVSDDGPGIDPELGESVFESGVTTSPDGSGFGLSIVASIAEAHGWEARIADGHRSGARFEFVETV